MADTWGSQFDSTESRIVNRKIRIRGTSKWLCTFQIMNPTKEMIPQNSRESSLITDKNCIAKIDERLRRFFRTYNTNGRTVRKSSTKVIRALAGQYIFHNNAKVIAGITILQTHFCSNPCFNSHLLLEKNDPCSPLISGGCHKIFIGHAYPVHTTEPSCNTGNALRPLLANWVDDSFFSSLHWLIPPSPQFMRRINPEEAHIKDEEALLGFMELIREMKRVLLETNCENLDQSMNCRPALVEENDNSQEQNNLSRSLYEFMPINRGQEYAVTSHHWDCIQVPLNANGSINEVAYRAVTSIKRKGGIVKTVSQTQ